MSVPAENFEAFRETLEVYPFMRGIRLNVAVEQDDHSFLKLTIKVRDKIVADGLNDETFDVTMRSIGLEFGHGFSFIGNNKHSWNLEFCFFKNMVL